MMELSEKVKRGLPLDDILIIDCHCHLGLYRCFNTPGAFAEGMLENMDTLGIDIVCISAIQLLVLTTGMETTW